MDDLTTIKVLEKYFPQIRYFNFKDTSWDLSFDDDVVVYKLGFSNYALSDDNDQAEIHLVGINYQVLGATKYNYEIGDIRNLSLKEIVFLYKRCKSNSILGIDFSPQVKEFLEPHFKKIELLK